MKQLISHESKLVINVREAAKQGTLSHALILSGFGDLTAAARYTAAAMLCRGRTDKPCMHCTACRKVMEDIHPDVHLVSDEEHKELSVESVRELRQDVYIRPNEGERKIYIFTRCDQLNERDQNVLLKIVEEGPSYAAFIFCAANAADLLPTIRSRCVNWKMDEEEESAESEQAMELCRCLADTDLVKLTEFTVRLENQRIKREQVQDMLCGAWRITAQAMLMQCGKIGSDSSAAECAALMSRSLPQNVLQKMLDILRRYAAECDYNVGTGHVLGAFAASCEELLRRK